MTSKDNKWLIVKESVILTPVIERVIVSLDKYFEKHKLKAYVTSGLRDANAQLIVIKSYLKKKGLDGKYPQVMICKVEDKLPSGEYVWQMAWSNLLNIGVIINPPIAAKCLMNYINKSGKNRIGSIISQTPHASGTAFNVGGGDNGIMDELAVLTDAKNDKLAGLKDFLAERENNALHVNCE